MSLKVISPQVRNEPINYLKVELSIVNHWVKHGMRSLLSQDNEERPSHKLQPGLEDGDKICDIANNF